jgi:O-antigen/teichoic acid export membrane protein
MVLSHDTKVDQPDDNSSRSGPSSNVREVGRGAMPAALGSVVSGVAAYIYLIVAARELGPTRYSALSSAWTLVFLFAAFFIPIEQEECRAAIARRAIGLGDRPVVVRCAGVGLVVLAFLLVCVGAAEEPLQQRLFAGHGTLVIALALGLGGYYLMFLTWGALASAGHFRGYGVVTGSEGILRLLICVPVLLLAPRSITGYALALGIAPILAAGAGWRAQPAELIDGPREPWGPTARAVGFLLGASVLRQFLLMVSPVVVQLLAKNGQRGAAGRYLAALALTRVPLYLFIAVLAALLPRMAELAEQGRRREFSSTIRNISILVCVVVGAASAVLYWVGPSLLGAVFGSAYEISAFGLLLLTTSCGLYMLALVLSYGLIAVSGHRYTTVSWGTGCVVFVVVAAAGESWGLLQRVEWGFFAGSGASALAMGALLVMCHRAHPWSRSTALIGELAQ